MEASLSSRHRRAECLVGAHVLAHRWPPFHWVQTCRGLGSAAPCFFKSTNPIPEGCTLPAQSPPPGSPASKHHGLGDSGSTGLHPGFLLLQRLLPALRNKTKLLRVVFKPLTICPVYLSIFLCFFPPHFSLETSSHMVILALSQISLFISGYLHLGHGLLLLLAPSAPTQTSSLGSDLISSDFINQAASPAGGSPSSPEPPFLPSVHHTSLLLLSCWSPSTDSQLHEG